MLVSVSWGLTALASAFLGLRLYCKFSTRRGLWWDDRILIAAWVRHMGGVLDLFAGCRVLTCAYLTSPVLVHHSRHRRRNHRPGE